MSVPYSINRYFAKVLLILIHIRFLNKALQSALGGQLNSKKKKTNQTMIIFFEVKHQEIFRQCRTPRAEPGIAIKRKSIRPVIVLKCRLNFLTAESSDFRFYR